MLMLDAFRFYCGAIAGMAKRNTANRQGMPTAFNRIGPQTQTS